MIANGFIVPPGVQYSSWGVVQTSPTQASDGRWIGESVVCWQYVPGRFKITVRRKRRGVKELGVSVLNRRRKPVLPSRSQHNPTTNLVGVRRSVDAIPFSTSCHPGGVKRKRCSDGSDSSLAIVDSLVKRVKSYYDADLDRIQQKYNPDGSLTRSQLDHMISQQQQKVRFLEEKQGLAELNMLSTQITSSSHYSFWPQVPHIQLPHIQAPFVEPCFDVSIEMESLFTSGTDSLFQNQLDFVDTFDWYGATTSLLSDSTESLYLQSGNELPLHNSAESFTIGIGGSMEWVSAVC
jgi:hypothetical protein